MDIRARKRRNSAKLALGVTRLSDVNSDDAEVIYTSVLYPSIDEPDNQRIELEPFNF